jgi:hypothetical protein
MQDEELLLFLSSTATQRTLSGLAVGDIGSRMISTGDSLHLQKVNLRRTSTNVILISIMAKRRPMQLRGPAPNAWFDAT